MCPPLRVIVPSLDCSFLGAHSKSLSSQASTFSVPSEVRIAVLFCTLHSQLSGRQCASFFPSSGLSSGCALQCPHLSLPLPLSCVFWLQEMIVLLCYLHCHLRDGGQINFPRCLYNAHLFHIHCEKRLQRYFNNETRRKMSDEDGLCPSTCPLLSLQVWVLKVETVEACVASPLLWCIMVGRLHVVSLHPHLLL